MRRYFRTPSFAAFFPVNRFRYFGEMQPHHRAYIQNAIREQANQNQFDLDIKINSFPVNGTYFHKLTKYIYQLGYWVNQEEMSLRESRVAAEQLFRLINKFCRLIKKNDEFQIGIKKQVMAILAIAKAANSDTKQLNMLLQFSPLLLMLSTRLSLSLHDDFSEKPNQQEMANTIWSVAAFYFYVPSPALKKVGESLLTDFCERFAFHEVNRKHVLQITQAAALLGVSIKPTFLDFCKNDQPKSSFTQLHVAAELNKAGYSVRVESFVENMCYADIFLPDKKMVIQIDGVHHLKKSQKIKDTMRDQFLEKKGYRVLRFLVMGLTPEMLASQVKGCIAESPDIRI